MANTCVFIHGSHHGAWCWLEFDKIFGTNQFNNIYINLPGHGFHQSAKTYSLNDYVEKVMTEIKKVNTPVTLIAHSFGGVVASVVAENAPELIDKIIYVCAFLLPSDYNTADIIKESHIISPLINHIIKDETADVMKVTADTARKYFYNQSPERLIQFAISHICDEPLSPTEQRIHLTDERFGKIKKFYIKTTNDLAILPNLQDYMLQKTKVKQIFSLDADHSPFFSAIPAFSELLTRLIR